MHLRLTLHHKTRQALMRQWQDALALGDRRLVKRVEALLAVAAGESLEQVSTSLALCEQSVRNYVKAFLLNGRDRLIEGPGKDYDFAIQGAGVCANRFSVINADDDGSGTLRRAIVLTCDGGTLDDDHG